MSRESIGKPWIPTSTSPTSGDWWSDGVAASTRDWTSEIHTCMSVEPGRNRSREAIDDGDARTSMDEWVERQTSRSSSWSRSNPCQFGSRSIGAEPNVSTHVNGTPDLFSQGCIHRSEVQTIHLLPVISFWRHVRRRRSEGLLIDGQGGSQGQQGEREPCSSEHHAADGSDVLVLVEVCIGNPVGASRGLIARPEQECLKCKTAPATRSTLRGEGSVQPLRCCGRDVRCGVSCTDN